MTQASLADLGQIIVDLAKSNQLFAQIAESSLNNIRTFICTPDQYDQVPQTNDPMTLPPQISQAAQMPQQVMAPQPMQSSVFGQGLLAPMMGNQIQQYIPATGNIPFLYHQQQ